MKKRWLSLLLGLCMLLPFCLTGCSLGGGESADDIAASASERASTIVMYVVTEDETDPEAAAAVSEALSAITKSKYKTQLVVRYCSANEYVELVEKNLALMEDAYNNDELWDPDVDEDEEEKKKKDTEEETDYNEYGIPETRYPEPFDFQVDILYISGLAEYRRLIDKGWLSPLTTAINGASLRLTDYIAPTLLTGAAENGIVYGIPNNCQIGEYTYMLLNKSIADKYFYTSSFDEFADVGGRILGRFMADAAAEGLLPFNGTMEDLLLLGARYWSIDPADYSIDEEFSIVGDFIDDVSLMGRGDVEVAFDTLTTDKNFVPFLRTIYSYSLNNYFGTAAKGEAFGVQIVKGDARLPELEEYSDYYVVPIRMPMTSNAEVFDNMFAVSAFTEDVTKTMEVVTLINTNAEARNLLQYGIENVNYVLDENGQVSRLNHSYMMDLKKTGNMLIAYPDVEAGYEPDAWDYARKQNNDSILDPLLGFDFKVRLPYKTPVSSGDDEDEETEVEPEQTKLNASALRYVKTESKNLLNAIKACASLEEFDALTATWRNAYSSSNKDLKNFTSKTNEDSPYKTYLDWANAGKYLPGQAEKATESESDESES